ncbi:MAG: PilZ domain-containing protein [Bdellovibrionales bacterium]
MEELKEFLHKRKYPRRKYIKPIGILVHGEYSTGYCEEIGEGGLLLNITTPLKKDETVILSLTMPQNEITIVRAIIRYVSQKGQTADGRPNFQAGFQFHTLGFKFKKKIRDYIAAKSEQEAMADLLA